MMDGKGVIHRENHTMPTVGTTGSHAPGDRIRPVTKMARSTNGESTTFW
ncbi:MAG: hypothetical protein ACFFCS_29585 [Candidatus Hodarchaeota archaeon]